MVVGATDGNTFFVQDRLGIKPTLSWGEALIICAISTRNVGGARAQPAVDASQDITGTSAVHSGGSTTITFTRPRVSTDTDDDVSLDQSFFFLHAWGGSVTYASANIGYHGNNRLASFLGYCIPANCAVEGGK